MRSLSVLFKIFIVLISSRSNKNSPTPLSVFLTLIFHGFYVVFVLDILHILIIISIYSLWLNEFWCNAVLRLFFFFWNLLRQICISSLDLLNKNCYSILGWIHLILYWGWSEFLLSVSLMGIISWLFLGRYILFLNGIDQRLFYPSW